MSNQYELAKARIQTLQILVVAEAKEYDAGWLDGAKKIYREGGRFASKGSGETQNNPVISKISESIRQNAEKQFASLTPEKQKKAKEELKTINNGLNELADGIDKMSPEEQEELRKFLASPDVKQVREEVAKLFDSVDKKAGKAFRQVDAKIDKELKEPGTLGKAMKRIQAIANDVIEGVKENPEIVVGAAISAACLIAGGAGVVALFSLPNLFSVGGVWGGLIAITEGATGSAIAQAFAAGGLSQLGFSASVYLVSSGLNNLVLDATMLVNKDIREEIKQIKAENERMTKESLAKQFSF
jgi:DNA-directed RNA polymerase subunit F